MAFGWTWFPYIDGLWNPYYGGFGHFNLPIAGAGYFYPGFWTWDPIDTVPPGW